LRRRVVKPDHLAHTSGANDDVERQNVTTLERPGIAGVSPS
jgi:hypothetical protein